MEENTIQVILNGNMAKKFEEVDKNLEKIEKNTAETSKKMTELVKNVNELSNALGGSVNIGINALTSGLGKLNDAIGKIGTTSKSSLEGTSNSTNKFLNLLNSQYSKLLQYENALNRLQTMKDVKEVKGETVSPRMLDAIKTYIKLIDQLKAKISSTKDNVSHLDILNAQGLYNAKSTANFEMAMNRYTAAIAKAEEQVRKLKEEEQKRAAGSQNDSAKDLQQLNKLYSQKLNYENQIASIQRGMAVQQAQGVAMSSNSLQAQAMIKYKELLDAVEKKIAEIAARNKEAAAAAEASNEPKRLQQEIANQERKEKALKRVEEAQRKLLDAHVKSQDKIFNASLGITEDPRTIEQYRIAIANLRKEIQKTTLDDAGASKRSALTQKMEEYKKKLQEVEGEQKKVAASAKEMSIGLKDIAIAAGVSFSLQGLLNFGKQVIEITGEFELQHRAMQAIIGDTHEANKLFEKTVALAVRSPYRIKDLVTYTKQLSAYRIETSKLYDTTKMLADISSGLGVDMGRLILAYGQVKAANYLRGQELRQFSEAGVNILGELSNYFSELEGRMISTGEVFDRVSKRMVSFEDVSVVLRRLTEEGGIFYNMQEIQAETLRGQITNLSDSFDIFMNAIGKQKRGVIITIIKAVRSAMENVRDIMPVINTALISLIARFAMLKIAATSTTAATTGWASLFGKNVEAAILSTKRMIVMKVRSMQITGQQIAMEKRLAAIQAGGASALSGWLTILSAVAIAITAIISKATSTQRAIKEMNGEVDKIASKASSDSDAQMEKYSELVNKIKETNSGSKDRTDIIAKINSVYGEYLDFQVTDITTQEELANAYDKVNERMRKKASLEAYQNGLEQIDSSLLKNMENMENELEGILSGGIVTNEIDKEASTDMEVYYKRLALSKEQVAILKELIKKKMEFLDPKDYDTEKERLKIIGDVVRKYFDDTTLHIEGKTSKMFDYFEKRAAGIMNLQAQIDAKFGDSSGSKKIDEEFKKVDELLEERKKAFSSRQGLSERDTELLDTTSLKYVFDELDREAERRKLKIKFDAKLISEDSYKDALDKINGWADGLVSSFNEKIKEKIPEYTSGFVYENLYIYEDMAEKGTNGLIEHYTRMYEAAKEYAEQIQKIKDAGALMFNQDELDKQTKLMKAYKYVLSLFGVDPDKKKTGNTGNPALERLNKQISAIKEANQQYKKYLELFNDTAAFDKVKTEFSGLFNELGMEGWVKSVDSFSDEAVKNAFNEKLKPSVVASGEKGRQAAAKYLTEWQYQIDKSNFDKALEKAKNAIDDMFADFKMGEELEKLGIGKDFAENIFDIDALDFDEMKTKAAAIKEDLVLSNADDFDGDAVTKWYEEVLKKISDAEDEQQRERLKKYVEYTKLAMNERAKIMYDGLSEAAEIEKTFDKEIEKAYEANDKERIKFLKAAKDAALEGSKDKTDKSLQKQMFEDFKASDLYVQMFSDIDKESSKVLELMKNRLTDIRESMKNLSPTELKAINDEIKKIDDQLAARSPFDTLVDSFKDAFNIIEKRSKKSSMAAKLTDLLVTGETKNKIDEQIEEEDKKIRQYEEEISALEAIAALKEKGTTPTDEQLEAQGLSDYKDAAQGTLDSLLDLIKAKKTSLKQSKDSQADLIQESQSLGELSEKAEKFAKSWSEMTGKISGAVSDVMDNLEAFGVETDNTTEAFGGLMKSIFDIIAIIPMYIAMMTAAGVAINSAMGVIGLIAEGVQLLIALVSAVAKLRDAGADDIIENMNKRVNELEESAKRLEDAFESAFSTDKLVEYNRQLEATLEKEIDAYKAMIAAERTKKVPDKEQIEEWNNTIYDLGKQIEDQRDKFFEELGGISRSGFRDAASEFVDAWYDAFKETGDGLSGLEDNFNEMLLNIVKKQAVLKITERLFKPLFDQIDEYLEDGRMTAYELESLRALSEERLPQINDALKEIFGSFGMLGDSSGSELTGLQKGIQGITEETAEILSAYLNSIRFYVVDSNTQLKSIASALSDNSGQSNPMLQELKNIASRTQSIYDFLYQRRETGTGALRVMVV